MAYKKPPKLGPHTGCECHGLLRMDWLAGGCTCEGCATLRAEHAIDPDLDPHIGCHLLIMRWASTPLTPGEKAYRRAHSPYVQKILARNAVSGYVFTPPTRTVPAKLARHSGPHAPTPS